MRHDRASRLVALFDCTSDAIIGADPDGLVVDWNAAAQRLFGYAPDEIIGRHIRMLVPQEGRASQRNILQGLARGRVIQDLETVRRAKDGSLIDVSMTVSRVTADDGTVLGTCAILRDLTDRMKVRQKLRDAERLACLGAVSAGAAHEISNPLTYVLGNLELLEAELHDLPINAARRKELALAVADVRDGAERIAHVVGGLKNLGRAAHMARTPVDLHHVLEVAARLANNEIRHRARLVREFGPVPVVHGDESRLVQVFVNLLLNAAQALPAGEVENHQVTLTARTSESGQAVVEVGDTGPGVDTAVLARMFEPFVTTRPGGSGMGLGLSICRDIVAAHDGTISVYRTDHGVTVFRVTLAGRATAIRAIGSENVPAFAPDPTPPTAGRVLIVDDEPHLNRLASRALGRDYDVLACDNATDALALIKGGRGFDVILCDLMMPQITGWDFYRRVAEFDSNLAARVIFVTGGVFTPEGRQFLETVKPPVLNKPFALGELRRFVSAGIERLAVDV